MWENSCFLSWLWENILRYILKGIVVLGILTISATIVGGYVYLLTISGPVPLVLLLIPLALLICFGVGRLMD